jgi:hypothetical protein
MPRISKQKLGGRGSRRALTTPPIDEIITVIRDQIQTLIDSFACPSEKDAAEIRAGRDWTPRFSQIQSPEIRREIVCLTRAIQLLSSIRELDLVPRGTNPQLSTPNS